MKRLLIYFWVAAFVFLANGWLCYQLSSWKFFSDQPPLWQTALTGVAIISQLPSLAVSRSIADYFDLSYTGWAITTSVISLLIYFPVIHLIRPWQPRVRMRSIRRGVSAFSSSLNPCGSARKRV